MYSKVKIGGFWYLIENGEVVNLVRKDSNAIDFILRLVEENQNLKQCISNMEREADEGQDYVM